MFNFRRLAHVGRHAMAALLLGLAGLASAAAADAPDNAGSSAIVEREMLAAVTRQLDLLERLVERAAATSPQELARYHFDYLRLRADLQRVRAGVQDYLVPQRAQPRDPVPLAAGYTLSANDEKEAASP